MDPTATTTLVLSPVLGPGLGPAYTVAEREKPEAPDYRRESVSGGLSVALAPFAPSAIPQFDTLYAQYGDALIDWMLTDPDFAGSVELLKEGALCDGLHFASAIEAEPDEDEEDADELRAEDAERTLAEEVAEFCNRMLARLKRPLVDVLYEMASAVVYRDVAAEVVGEICVGGPDDGRAVLKALRPKPRWAWAYTVDRVGEVMGIKAYVPDRSDTVLMSRDKFAVLSFNPQKGDPRGTTVARAAFNGWNIKLQTMPEWFRFGKKLAGPSIKATVSPNAQPRTDQNGVTVTPEQDLYNNLSLLITSCGVVVAPPGTEIDLLEVQGDGSAFDRLKDACDREMVMAVLQATRGTLESKHGSKADSETSQDVTGLVVRRLKQQLATVALEAVRPFVVANWGQAVADRGLVKALLGDTDHQDFGPNANAIAALWQSGALDESQRPALMAWLGLPRPKKRAPAEVMPGQAPQQQGNPGVPPKNTQAPAQGAPQ